MKPAPNAVHIVDNLIPEETHRALADKYKTAGWRFYWRSSHARELHHWHTPIVDRGKGNTYNLISDFLRVLPGNESEAAVLSAIYDRYGDFKLLRLYANGYTFGTEGAPHTGSERTGETTICLYLNDAWEPSWGGETAVFGAGQYVATLPAPRRAVLFPAEWRHVARPVSKTCNELRMVLVLKVLFVDSIIDENMFDFLGSLGADASGHSGGTLLQHLTGVYRLLRERGATDAVCLAGLFHSVYGTAIYQTAHTDDRELIRSIIGQEAEHLAFMFSRLARPNCWRLEPPWLTLRDGTSIASPDDERRALRQIEDANQDEQRSRLKGAS